MLISSDIRNIAIATVAFVNETTLRPGKGGLQRWCLDVARLLVSKGLSVTVLQKASRQFDFVLEENIRVVGIKAPMKFYGNVLFSRKLSGLIRPDAPIIFLSQELMLGCKAQRAIAVNHGIWWDSDFAASKLILNKLIQRITIAQARGVICVDTNYINWCHAEIPNRKGWRHKLKFVPNYADATQFSSGSVAKIATSASRIHILYPRRLGDGAVLDADGRGALFLLQALARLYEAGVDFQVEFAGPGTLRAQVLKFAQENGFGDAIKCSEYNLEEMPIAYANTDIVVIPSMSHEGTSLAAVEGICAGKPTVVTHIGGLPNLVINSLNGFMCDLTVESLCKSILQAASRREDHAWRREAALIGATHFGKVRWEVAVWEHLVELLELRAY